MWYGRGVVRKKKTLPRGIRESIEPGLALLFSPREEDIEKERPSHTTYKDACSRYNREIIPIVEYSKSNREYYSKEH